MICQTCGMVFVLGEYHPYTFCVLVKAGLDPLAVYLEAVKQLADVTPDVACSGPEKCGEYADVGPEICHECWLRIKED